MKTVGFPISHKENENRRTIVPQDIYKMSHPELLYIEKGYGEVLGISDDEYKAMNCCICSHEDALSQNIICDPKIGDADYLEFLHRGQTVFGWIHATQNRDITEKLLSTQVTAYAWEKMYKEGRHIFWRNNELAGEAAVLHAFQCFGQMPYEVKVAVIGNGNTARGAMKALNMFGSDVTQYSRRTEPLFREEMGQYDVIINCVLWDVGRNDHIIYRSDLKRLHKNAMIIDVSCDRGGAIETSIPTTIANPIYFIDGICHYVVDHTPSLFFRTFSFNNSGLIVPYIENLQSDHIDSVLGNAMIVRDGIVVDQEINNYQNR